MPMSPARKRIPARVAVAVPCYNEALTIARVVRDFRRVLPEARVYVFDNHSTDDSAVRARRAGATVIPVPRPGKGNVMRAIFDSLDADVILIVDGDDTYDAADAPRLIEPVLRGQADMVVGDRLAAAQGDSFRWHRHLGNRLILWGINLMFGSRFRDILSGYRAVSRRLVETVPLLTPGFETETELTLQTLEEGLVIVEVPVAYRSRPEGSHSKLRAFRDGYRIMLTAAILLRDHYPLRLYGLISLLSLLAAVLSGLIWSLLTDGRLALLVLGLTLLFAFMAMFSLGVGLILSAIVSRFRELKQISRRQRYR